MSQTILVVDDSRAMRMLLSRALAALGFDAIEAGNGRDAIEKLRNSEDVSAALVDWNMPEMNGLEFVKSVRAEAAWNDLPVLLVTSETDTDRIRSALEHGANEYVIKPFTQEGLASKLHTAGVL
jgi:two-component system chemotaxis response regulator CheY